MLRGLCAGLAALLIMPSSFAVAQEWELVRDEEGIRVWLRPVAGSSYKAFRSETLMNTDMATLRELQEDVEASCAWIHSCREQRLLSYEGDTALTYTRFDTPWPVQARDSVMQVTTREEGGSLLRELLALPQQFPPDKAYQRISAAQGYWRMTPDGEGRIRVVYELHAEPGGQVPAWLANSFVIDAPYNTLLLLRRAAEAR